ncbi:MAG: hypothetical protein V4621_07275 [Pseudomonadota bacterium]
MRVIILSLMMIGLTFSTAVAQDKTTVKPGIRTLTITPPALETPVAPAAPDDSDTARVQKPVVTNTENGEAPHFIAAVDSTKEWPHLRGLLLPADTTEFQTAMAALRENPSAAPPQALLYGATSMVNAGQFADAAVYQQAALLRTALDGKRFENGAAWRRYAAGIAAQGAALNDATYPYILQSPDHLIAILQAVIVWDKTTRYAYALPLAVQVKTQKTFKAEEDLSATRGEFVTRWLTAGKSLWPQAAEKLDAAKVNILK